MGSTREGVRLRFAYNLTDSTFDQHRGVLFHEWLPAGQQDAIEIHGDRRSTVAVWFERQKVAEHVDTFIVENDIHFGEDPAQLSRFGNLRAELLHGVIQINCLSASERHAIEEDIRGDDLNAAAKEVLKTLTKVVRRFLRKIRVIYGQYWIKTPDEIDTREGSIEHFASKWQLHRYDSHDETWRPLNAGHGGKVKISSTVASEESLQSYLTEEDWRNLSTTQAPPDSPGLELLIRAIAAWDRGEFRMAYIDGATSLELAVQYRLDKHVTPLNPEGNEALSGLDDQQSLLIAAALAGLDNSCVLAEVKECIDERNSIVHEGTNPQDRFHNNQNLFHTKDAKRLQTLFEVIEQLYGGKDWRLPLRYWTPSSRISPKQK